MRPRNLHFPRGVDSCGFLHSWMEMKTFPFCAPLFVGFLRLVGRESDCILSSWPKFLACFFRCFTSFVNAAATFSLCWIASILIIRLDVGRKTEGGPPASSKLSWKATIDSRPMCRPTYLLEYTWYGPFMDLIELYLVFGEWIVLV